MEIKSKFDHFNINVTNLSVVSTSTRKLWDLRSTTEKKLPTVLLHWFTSQIAAPVFYWSSPISKIIPNRMNWAKMKVTFAFVLPVTMMPSDNTTRITTGSALRIPPWDYISFTILMITG